MRIGFGAIAAIGLVVFDCALAVAPAVSAEVADPANGLKLARRWCADCHVVEPGQTSAHADVPSFASLATDPLKADDRIANVLAVPEKAHSKMQNLTLSRVEIMDIVGYIKSLRP